MTSLTQVLLYISSRMLYWHHGKLFLNIKQKKTLSESSRRTSFRGGQRHPRIRLFGSRPCLHTKRGEMKGRGNGRHYDEILVTCKQGPPHGRWMVLYYFNSFRLTMWLCFINSKRRRGPRGDAAPSPQVLLEFSGNRFLCQFEKKRF